MLQRPASAYTSATMLQRPASAYTSATMLQQPASSISFMRPAYTVLMQPQQYYAACCTPQQYFVRYYEEQRVPIHTIRQLDCSTVRRRAPPPRPKPNYPDTGTGETFKVAGGFKVLDERGRHAREDLFYGRFTPSPSASQKTIHDDDPTLARNEPRLAHANRLARAVSNTRLARMRPRSATHSASQADLRQAGFADTSRKGSREARAYLPASHTASLSSSRSVDDLTHPGEFPGTEFGHSNSKPDLAFRGY